MTKSIFTRILDETQQSVNIRYPLLEKIGDFFERRAIGYFTSFMSQYGAVGDQDVDLLKDLLLGKCTSEKKLLLIIDSPGGSPLAAERFIKICREFSDNDYWVLIPGKAKSAATMISLGSSKLFMTPTSELGPIDMQVPWNDRLMPASLIIEAYDKLMAKGIKLKKDERMEPILQQLEGFDAPLIEDYRQARDLSDEIARKVLNSGMLKGMNKTGVAGILKKFLDPKELKAHGRPIFYSDLLEIDKRGRLSIDLIKPTDERYSTIHEYHMRATHHLMVGGKSKLLETAETAFSA